MCRIIKQGVIILVITEPQYKRGSGKTVIFSVKPPRRRRGRSEYGSNTLRRSQGVFEPYSPLTSKGKVVLQFILRPPGSIWRAGSSIWKAGGGIWRVGGGI